VRKRGHGTSDRGVCVRVLAIDVWGGFVRVRANSFLKCIFNTKGAFGIAFVPAFRSNLNFFFFFTKIECGLYFLDCFDVLMSKMIFKK
jgi:hypothetical protein